MPAPDLSSITTDLLGKPRIYGSTIDIGAYEYQDTYRAVVPNANGIIYVNSSITSGNKDGSSRSNAFIRLCDALKFSEAMNAVTPETVKQIWVAEGTYYSIHKSAEIDGNGKFTTDRDNVFSMVKEVKVYGHYLLLVQDKIYHSHLAYQTRYFRQSSIAYCQLQYRLYIMYML